MKEKTTSIISLHHFMMGYLKKLTQNIPENLLYAKQLDQYNSAGWILGHIVVESKDVFEFLNIDLPIPIQWVEWFYNSSPKWVAVPENLPSKDELFSTIQYLYNKMIESYIQLDSETLNQACPSKLIGAHLPNVDAWIAHHLTTHIAVHCGNITVWKKLMGLDVQGY